jgi:hypothetical protein
MLRWVLRIDCDVESAFPLATAMPVARREQFPVPWLKLLGERGIEDLNRVLATIATRPGSFDTQAAHWP